FTSADITRPEAKYDIRDKQAEANVEGTIPLDKNTAGLTYQRRFLLEPNGVTLPTTFHHRPPLALAEPLESLPVLLHDGAKDVKVRIQFQTSDQWQEATTQAVTSVKAIRIDRGNGGVLITLDKARSVQLAPRDWTDGFQTRATCQTILVNLLDVT